MQETLFEHNKLLPGQFRLLRMLSGNDTALELSQACIDNPPPYLALSYTWDLEDKPDPHQTLRTVSLNGHILPVTENLHDALTHLGPFVREENRYLWIDAICINQQSLAEKASQVRMMVKIYSQAEGVLVWLGRSQNEELTKKAVAVMKDADEFCDKMHQKHDGDLFAAKTQPRDGLTGSTDIQEAWQEVVRLLHLRWFNRMWVYQEASVNRTTLFFRDKVSFFDRFIFAAILMANYFGISPGVPRQHQICSDIVGSPAGNLWRFRRIIQNSVSRNIFDMMCALQNTDCSDPRDKVHAPRGLATNLSDNQLVPDYTTSLEETYINVVNFCLSSKTHQLAFLGYIVHQRQYEPSRREYGSLDFYPKPPVPSWAPDWRLRFWVMPLLKSYDIKPRYPSETSTAMYHASLNSSVRAVVDGVHLRINGIQMATLAELARPWLKIGDDGVGFPPSTGIDLEKEQQLVYPTGESIGDAYRRTVTADVCEEVGGSLKRPGKFDLNISNQDHQRPHDSPASEGEQNIYNRLRYACLGRRFGWTTNKYMGLFPAAAEPGDEVCVFLGGAVLYVIRGVVNGEYEFIGECYVHGLIDGEALTSEGESNVVLFDLIQHTRNGRMEGCTSFAFLSLPMADDQSNNIYLLPCTSVSANVL